MELLGMFVLRELTALREVKYSLHVLQGRTLMSLKTKPYPTAKTASKDGTVLDERTIIQMLSAPQGFIAPLSKM